MWNILILFVFWLALNGRLIAYKNLIIEPKS